MRFIDSLYTYGYKDKKIDKIINKIKKAKVIPGLYLVVLPLFDDGLLEIYVYNQLLQPYYKSLWDNICVLGVSSSKSGAQELVQSIIQDVYDCDENLDINNFFRI